MLHELLFGLLGFTGDILVGNEDNTSFQVKPGFDLVSISERDQLNKIAPLGWYYKKLSAFVEQYEMRWDGQREIQTYLVALSLGLQDFLGEYTASIATLEQTILQEGPLPLSFVTQHFQKYLLSMPVVWRICCDINERELKGCQILDYLSFYKSGVPVISLVVARLLLRVRVVFLKQSMAWMVHGELNDPASEYFIQHHKHSFSQGSGHHRCFTASPKEDAELAFDWGSSYSLKLSRIPESHVSPRLASTILFVGKAVTLLAFSNSQLTEKIGTSRNKSTAFQEVFDYFSGRRRDTASAPVTANMPTSLGDAPESLHADGADFVRATMTDHFSNNGFSAEDIHRFSMQYEHILTHQAHAVASFEALVTTISETVSRSLWRLLRDVHDFRQFTHTLRNTYLMGRGEFFQSILDNILVFISESSSYEEGDEIDALLRERILKAAAEKHGFDDGSLIRLFQIRVNSPVVRVGDFVSEALVFTGTAGNVKQSGVHVGLLCTAPLLSASSSFAPIWTNLLKPLEVSGADATVEQKSQLPLYTSGSLWLPDLKFIAKGFTMSAAFSLDWNAVMASISPSHPNLLPSSLEPSATSEEGGRSLLLGSMAVVVHGDKQGPRAVVTGSLGCDILRSLAAGVSFHTCLSLSDSSSPTLQYYARLFVSTRGSAVSTVLAERRVQLSFNQRATDESLRTNHRTCNASVDLIFELEYAREFAASEDRSGSGGVVNLVLKVRLKEASPKTAAPLAWDIELPLDISSVVKMQGGHAFVGLSGSAIILDSTVSAFTVKSPELTAVSKSPEVFVFPEAVKAKANQLQGIFGIRLIAMDFLGKGALATYPVASSYTTTRHPETYSRLDAIVSRLRAWLTLKLTLLVPPILSILVDAESLIALERLFAFIFKVRLIGHAIEKLWNSAAFLCGKHRQLCQMRLCLHFFISNLLYFLQEDVVDVEFTTLSQALDIAADFQEVLKAYKSFVSNLIRLAMVDNLTIQECFERIFQICLRFIAVSRLLNEQVELNADTRSGAREKPRPRPVIVASEEITSIQQEFISQVSQLFQILRKVETRGFIFRLDFNGFLSNLLPGTNRAVMKFKAMPLR